VAGGGSPQAIKPSHRAPQNRPKHAPPRTHSKHSNKTHDDRILGVVALPQVQQPGQPVGQRPQLLVVEPELAAAQGEHHRVLGQRLDHLGVVLAAGLGAVAAADDEDVAQLAGLRLCVGVRVWVRGVGGVCVGA